MSKRTRILLVILGGVVLCAAVWIALNTRFVLREVTYADDTVDVELVTPAGS